MFTVNQKVLLPNGLTGTIVSISKRQPMGDGMVNGKDRIKVRYEDMRGGLAEGWFPTEQVKEFNFTEQLNKIDEDIKKLEEVSEIKNREELDWISTEEVKPDTPKQAPITNDETNFEG